MGFRFRKSVSLGKGLRLNFGKTGVGLSAGVKGARVSYNTNGRKTTSVGIPGTGISYVKTEKIGGKESGPGSVPPVTPGNGNNLLGSNPAPKKKHGCGSFVIGAVVLVVIIALFQQCTGGGNSTSSSQSSPSMISSEGVSSNILSSEPASSEVPSSEAPSSSAVSKPESVPISSAASADGASNSKIVLTGAPGTVANGSSAALSIKGKPNTQYTISVFYSSGASKADGLEAKTSGSDGSVSWSWKVGAKTKAGTHRIVISGGGDQLETSMITTK